MADYWKSQPRKFCQYCKCWIADNKPSIDFHERGKNHKENVAAKISEIKKKSVQKAKQDEKMGKQFAAMEEAAMKAYEEDLKRMEREAAFGPEAETTSTASTTSTYQPVPRVQPAKQPQSSRDQSQQKQKQSNKKEKEKKVQLPRAAAPAQHPPHPQHPHYPHLLYPPHLQHPQHTGVGLWVEGKSNEGYTYFYNTATGESRWDNPLEQKAAAAAQSAQGQMSAVGAWMEALSPEGYTYYYNTVTRASSWEKPTDYTPKDKPGSSEREEAQDKTTEEEVGKENKEKGATNELSMTGTEATQQLSNIHFKRKADTNGSEDTTEAAPKTEGEKDKEDKEDGGITTASQKSEEKYDEAPTGRFRPPNPYGTWERVKEDKDPYKNVDWQLPQVRATDDTVAVELPPEPKHKFKTRVITSLGDRSNSGPVAFKRKKTHNSKSRSLRQREDDE